VPASEIADPDIRARLNAQRFGETHADMGISDLVTSCAGIGMRKPSALLRSRGRFFRSKELTTWIS
jgi:hypothetical protein